MPKSHSHYQDFLDLRGNGRVVLYKRADHQNPKWTVRLKIPETDGFVVKSTKTTDDFEARRFAEELYYRLEEEAHRGEPINSATLGRVFSDGRGLPSKIQGLAPSNTSTATSGGPLWALRYFDETPIEQVAEVRSVRTRLETNR